MMMFTRSTLTLTPSCYTTRVIPTHETSIMVGLQDDDNDVGDFGRMDDQPQQSGSSAERSESPRDEHDYTENASAADIALAIEQQRKEGEEVIGQNMEGGGPDSGK